MGAALSAAALAALEASLLPDAEQQWLLDAPAVERPAEAGPSLTLGSLVERTLRRAQNSTHHLEHEPRPVNSTVPVRRH